MAKFKIGDRVRNLVETEWVAKGEVGTVIEDGPIPDIKWDNYETAWCRHENCLELIQDNQSLHLTTQGNTIHAVLKQGNKVVKRAKSTCSPSDEFNFEFGAKLAFSRLVDGVYIGGVDMAFNSVKEVNRPAKVGEWVKMIEDVDFSGKTIKKDEIIKITHFGTMPSIKYRDFFIGFVKDEYVVLENYQPTQPVSIDYSAIDYSKLDGAKLFEEVKRRVEENGTNTRQ